MGLQESEGVAERKGEGGVGGEGVRTSWYMFSDGVLLASKKISLFQKL